jgi:hypothetical protein
MRPTERELADVARELASREPIFHRAEFGTSRADFEGQMDAAFREVGASGRRYGAEDVLHALEQRHRDGAEQETLVPVDLRCDHIAGDAYLVTYDLRQGERLTRRATIWRRDVNGAWRILYHQGTVVADD